MPLSLVPPQTWCEQIGRIVYIDHNAVAPICRQPAIVHYVPSKRATY